MEFHDRIKNELSISCPYHNEVIFRPLHVFSKEDVKVHKDRSSMFTIVNGKVNVRRCSSLACLQLLSQLAPGGRMLIPVGEAHSDQRFVQVDKDQNGEITARDLMGVIYVPLTTKERQMGHYL